MLSILSESFANEKGYSANGRAWLFTNEILPLRTVTALDLVANSVWWNIRSKSSTIATSIVLLIMAWISTVQSWLDWLTILFKDRPIVRDYKELLDLETEFFDMAFFRAQQINLTRKIDADSKILDDLDAKIKEYQSRWLLATSGNIPRSISFSDIIVSLIAMNASMKWFLGYTWPLSLYYSCLWDSWCRKDNAVLKFDSKFISQIEEDYEWTWVFWTCNQYGAYFKGTLKKAFRNNDSVKASFRDIKEAHARRSQAFLSKQRWENTFNDPCEMSEYEMAQLKAYRWSERECWEWISVSSALSATKDFLRNKSNIKIGLKQKANAIKESAIQWLDAIKDFFREIQNKYSTSDKKQSRYTIFWSWVTYDPEFSYDRYLSYVDIYGSINTELYISQLNAMSTDLSFELHKIKGLIDQVDAASNAIWNDNDKKWLKKQLSDVANYQCSS